MTIENEEIQTWYRVDNYDGGVSRVRVVRATPAYVWIKLNFDGPGDTRKVKRSSRMDEYFRHAEEAAARSGEIAAKRRERDQRDHEENIVGSVLDEVEDLFAIAESRSIVSAEKIVRLRTGLKGILTMARRLP